tara:strand:+ start:13639 stop:15747 length:2109 start_codon:yes stop_codon:yes gene_type:complete
MAIQSKTTLKTHFVSNATPDQDEFGHLIDSNLNLAETGEQICVGIISASALNAESYNLNAFSYSDILITNLTESNQFGNSSDDIHSFSGSIHHRLGHITSSGNISSSNTILTKFLQLPQATGGTSEGAIHFGGTADDNGFIYDDNNHLILGYNDTDIVKIHDTNPKVEIQGNLKVTNNITSSGNISSSGTLISDEIQTFGHITSSGNISSSGTLISNEVQILGHITASGNISASGTITAESFVGSLTATGFDLNDNNKIKLGTGDDLQIFHDGSNSYISQSGVGNLIIGNTVQEKNIIFNTQPAGSPLPQTHLTLDGDNEKTLFSQQVDVGVNGGSGNPDFYLFSNTNNQYIHWDASESDLHCQDNVIVSFGDGKDLQIKHDGSNSYISQSGVGNLIIGNEDKNTQIKGPVEFLSATGESHSDPTLIIKANRNLLVSGSITVTGSIDTNNNTPKDDNSVGFQSYGHEYSFYCKGADDFSGYYLQNNSNKFIIKTDGRGTADNGGGSPRAEANFFEYASNQNDTTAPYRGVIRLRVPSSHFNQTNASMEVIDAYHLKQNVASSGGNAKHLRVGIGGINSEGDSSDITLHVKGKIKAETTVFDSDERLKENIKPLESQLNNIKQLKPSRFDWKDQTKSRYTDDVGFIAQEIRNILPILVTGDESEGDMLSVDYSKLTPILVKALQEQQEIIESLTKRIEDLENK